ncbi:MAG: ubiquinol-cytochrome C chaperone family protein [Sphingomonas sp.]
MLSFLFRGLTALPARGESLFAAITAEARRPFWYLECEVPDTLDGRFAVLATLGALVLVRLERDGDCGNAVSVGFTERFIEVMEAEHRELGIGDPTLGRTVRKLVGMLARRTELWRSASEGQRPWREASRDSLYKSDPTPQALEHGASALEQFRNQLDERTLTEIEQGAIE